MPATVGRSTDSTGARNSVTPEHLSDWEGNCRDDRCPARERGRIAVHRWHGTLAAVDEGAQRLYESDCFHKGHPGEDELQALTEGALRVLRGEEKPRFLTAEREAIGPGAK